MKKLNRRDFIGQSAMGLSGALALSQVPMRMNAKALSKAIKQPIGFRFFL
ncbi:MAG: twin-arginine translocation signal domain-containing protein [Ginsengibacter sp.]